MDESQPLLQSRSELLSTVKVFPLIPSLKRDVVVSINPLVFDYMLKETYVERHWCVSPCFETSPLGSCPSLKIRH